MSIITYQSLSQVLKTGKGAARYFTLLIRNPKGFLTAARGYMERRAQAAEMMRHALQASDLPALDSVIDTDQSSEQTLIAFSRYFAVLELHQTPYELNIGVRNVDLIALLQWIKRSYPRTALNPFDPALCKKLLSSPVITVELPRAHRDRPLRIQVEPYAISTHNRWISPNPRNHVMRCCYGSELSSPGLTRASSILGAPLLSQQQDTQKVDAVFTWVDHSDPDWQGLFKAHLPDQSQDILDSTKGSDATSIARFHSNDELRYALRSIWNNLPWISHVHIFSNCRPPEWLDTSNKNISWIHHKSVIPHKFLPTFNSHVIESFLHRIPNISDRFLYMNDDFFIMRRKERSDFFSVSGQSIARLEGYGMVAGPLRNDDPDYLNASRNSQALLRKHLGFAATELHSHVPYALKRSVLEEIEDQFRAHIEAFRGNRFRSMEDLNIPSFFYHHYAMATGRAFPAKASAVLVKSNDHRWREQLVRADQKRHDFVCINEGGTETPSGAWHNEVRVHLARWFPHSAPWER